MIQQSLELPQVQEALTRIRRNDPLYASLIQTRLCVPPTKHLVDIAIEHEVSKTAVIKKEKLLGRIILHPETVF